MNTQWRYETKHGPNGEENYAWVYDENGNLVCTAKLHHAIAIVSRATPPSPVPDGWVTVPREPTPEMHEAAVRMDIPRLWEHERAALYRAMISAAPAAPTEARDE